MGFFKGFKEDFSDAVDELIPGGSQEDSKAESSRVPLDTDSNDINVQDELNKLDGLLEQVSKKVDENDGRAVQPASVRNGTSKKEKISEADFRPEAEEKSAIDSLQSAGRKNTLFGKTEEKKMDKETVNSEMNTAAAAPAAEAAAPAPASNREVSDENAVITSGMSITGDLTSIGSINVEGLINGNVTCNGKLTVTGTINGNSSSSEFFADAAKVEGEIKAEGTVKIGLNSVIIGNISATSAVIAGAVKGDIDVQGPVVIDTSVIQGFCSQEYADVDVEGYFA